MGQPIKPVPDTHKIVPEIRSQVAKYFEADNTDELMLGHFPGAPGLNFTDPEKSWVSKLRGKFIKGNTCVYSFAAEGYTIIAITARDKLDFMIDKQLRISEVGDLFIEGIGDYSPQMLVLLKDMVAGNFPSVAAGFNLSSGK